MTTCPKKGSKRDAFFRFSSSSSASEGLETSRPSAINRLTASSSDCRGQDFPLVLQCLGGRFTDDAPDLRIKFFPPFLLALRICIL